VPGASVCFWSVYIRQARRRRRVDGLKAASARLIRHLAYVAGVHAVAGRRAESRISHLSSRPAHNDNALLSYSYGDGGRRTVCKTDVRAARRLTLACICQRHGIELCRTYLPLFAVD